MNTYKFHGLLVLSPKIISSRSLASPQLKNKKKRLSYKKYFGHRLTLKLFRKKVLSKANFFGKVFKTFLKKCLCESAS